MYVSRDWLSGVLCAVVAKLVVVCQDKVPLPPHLPFLYQPACKTSIHREHRLGSPGWCNIGTIVVYISLSTVVLSI